MGSSSVSEKNQWRIRSPDFEPRHSLLSCLDATICPCAGYSRVSQHVRSSRDSQAADVTRKDGFFTRQCGTYLACLPFYSCFIAKLQSDFRKVYNLEGNHCLDCLAACLCPAGSVSRMEMEAAVRGEECRLSKGQPGNGLNPAEAYKQPEPMHFPGHLSGQSRQDQPAAEQSSTPSSPGTAVHVPKDLGQECETLSARPEPLPAAESAVTLNNGLAQEQELTRYSKRNSSTDNAQAPVVVNTRPWSILKFLGQSWSASPPLASQSPEKSKRAESTAESPGKPRIAGVEPKQGDPIQLTAQTASHSSAHSPEEDGAKSTNGQSRFTEHI